ncbi:MAG: LysM peptidoglycan-binding domain-containing protein [Desulfofundulus sp.]
MPSVSWADLKHTVAPGETLYQLSLRYGTTVEALQTANGLYGPLIHPGQVLVIPGSTKVGTTHSTPVKGESAGAGVGRYIVRPGDSLYLIAKRYGLHESSLKEANNLSSDLIFPGQVLVIPAGTSRVSRGLQVSRGGTDCARAVLAMAFSLLGRPYAYGGSGPGAFDCSGFTSYVFRETVGINLPHNAAAQARLGTRVGRYDLSPGDLVFFGYYGSGDINHVGIYVGQDRFIHASSSEGVKFSCLSESYYAANYRGATRILR